MRIEAATLTNTSGSSVTVSIWLPSGGSGGVSNAGLQDYAIAAGASYVVKELVGHILEDGFAIEASASTGGVVALVISGLEIASA